MHFYRILTQLSHRYAGSGLFRENLVLISAYLTCKLSAWPCCVTGTGQFHDSFLELLDGIALMEKHEAEKAKETVEMILEDIGSGIYAEQNHWAAVHMERR